MGLFLARQLIVGMHGGSLELVDCQDGGALATVEVPGVEPSRGGVDVA